MRRLETIRADSCWVYDPTFGDTIVGECKDGIYKEWYSNGKIKIRGQYECLFMGTAKNVKIDSLTEKIDTLEINQYNSVLAGTWFEYDSLGHLSKMIDYNTQGLKKIFNISLPKDTILDIRTDSVWIKIKDYLSFNKYVIRRLNNKKHLFLEFPVLGDWGNVWTIFDYRLNFITQNTISYKEALYFFVSTDHPTKNGNYNYFDFSKLPSGRYYLYYYNRITGSYELEIVLEDLK